MAKQTSDITRPVAGHPSPFSRIRTITAEAANRLDHVEYGRLHKVEFFLAEIRHEITTLEADATGEALEILQDVKRSIFGDGTVSELPRKSPIAL